MITLAKTHPTHACTEVGRLYVNGEVVKINDTSVTVKINRVKGLDTGTIYDHFLIGAILPFPKIDCDLYS